MPICGLLFFLSLVISLRAMAACSPDVTEVSYGRTEPGSVRTIPMPEGADGLLLEEVGSDFDFRMTGEVEFRDIAIRPPRLGVRAVRNSGRAVEVRSRAFQMPGSLRVRVVCGDPGTLEFFEQLESSFIERIDSGRTDGLVAEVDDRLESESDPHRRAWLLQLRSNALETRGHELSASAAYLEARRAWLAVGDSGRAAVDLMASAEDLSRAGEYARAGQSLDQAIAEMQGSNLRYYRLRSISAKCLIESRLGRVRVALNCDIPIVAEMRKLGELSEASWREVSIANQWLKLAETDKARAALLRADEHAESLSKYSIGRLSAAFGNYYLQIGDVTAAAREYAVASKRFEVASLPRDQANIDLKLSRLAHYAGAYGEELRLIDHAIGNLDVNSGREQIGDAMLRASDANRALGNSIEAEADLAEAERLCVALQREDCLDAIEFRRVRSLVAGGKLTQAKTRIDSMTHGGAQWGPLRAWIDNAMDQNASTAQAGRLSAVLASAETQDPDLAVELAASIATILSDRGSVELARSLILDALSRMSSDVRRWPSMALRIGARSRLGRLQMQWFDLLPDQEGTILSRALSDSLWTVIELNGAEETLASGVASVNLTDDLRGRLSKSIFSGADIDQRQLFIGLSRSEPVSSESDSSAPAKASPDAAGSSDRLIVVPVLGISRFRLIAMMGADSKICMTMPAAAYRQQVKGFNAALEGESSDVLRLDEQASSWFRHISTCVASAPAAQSWWVVSTPATPPLPWSWISAAAEKTGAVEPAVTIGFARPQESPAIRLPFDSADVFQLNLGGEDSLPGASGEERDVLAILSRPEVSSGVEVLQAPVSTDALLTRIMKPGGLVHVIGHSNNIGEGQLYSGIWFPGSRGPTLLTMPELASTRSRASLIVLSACGTGIRNQSGASAKVGLGEALVAGGAAAVVAASNGASDSASARWVSEFYRNLIASAQPAIALKAARQYLRSLPPFRHPKYWAGIDLLASSRGAGDSRN